MIRTHQSRFERGGVVRRLGLAGDVEQVYAHEDDEEAAKQGYGVYAASGVETLE